MANRVKAIDESGKQVFVTEIESRVPMGTLEDPHATSKGLSSMIGPDGEQLTRDGECFRGIHSGKKYKLEA